MYTKDELISAGIVVGAGFVFGSSIYLLFKMNKLVKVVNATTDTLADGLEIDVPESMIKYAVEKAVNREVKAEVEKIGYDIRRESKDSIKKQVSVSVDEAKSGIKSSVETEIKKQLFDLDITDMKREVKAEAKQKVMDKFEGDLDSILEDFNKNLENVTKIYDSIATSVSKKNETPTLFKV